MVQYYCSLEGYAYICVFEQICNSSDLWAVEGKCSPDFFIILVSFFVDFMYVHINRVPLPLLCFVVRVCSVSSLHSASLKFPEWKYVPVVLVSLT